MSKRRRQRAPAPSEPQKTEGVGVLGVFLIVGGLLAGYHFLVAPFGTAEASATHTGPAQSIMVVDSKAVLQAFMRQKEDEIAGGATYTEGEVMASGADFAAEYLRAIKKYRDAGFLVIDKQYALGVPVGSEITEEIGKALSLDVKAAPDPFQAPALD